MDTASELLDVWCAALHILRFVIIDNDCTSRFSHDHVKQTTVQELEKAQNENSILTKRNIHIAISLVRFGLSCIRQANFEEANRNFNEALNNATTSFNESNNFADLSLSVRLQIFCTIMVENGCYIPNVGDVCNRTQLIENCQRYFKQLTCHPIVSPSLRDEFDGRSAFNVFAGKLKLSDSGRASRQHMLHELNNINIFFESKFDFRFPVYKSPTETVNLSEAKDLVITRSTTQICCMALHKGRLFAGCGDNCIVVYDLSTFNKVEVLRGHSFFVEALLVHQDVLYSCSYDRSVILWDLTTLKMLRVLTQCGRMVSSLAVHINSCSSSRSGSSCGNARTSMTLFTGSVGDDPYLRVWTLPPHNPSSSSSLCLSERRLPYPGAFSWVYALLVNHDRLYVSSTWYRGTDEALHFHCITVWDLTTSSSSSEPHCMTLVGILKGHFHNIRSLSVYGSHTLCSGSCDKTVILWDMQSLELQQILKGHSGEVSSITHFNSRLYVSDGGKGVRSWPLLSLSGSSCSGSDDTASNCSEGGKSAAFHEPIRHLVAERGRLFILSGGSLHVRLL